MKRGMKARIARALGIALTPKAARVVERRPNPPGQHGAATWCSGPGSSEQIPVQCKVSLIVEYYSR